MVHRLVRNPWLAPSAQGASFDANTLLRRCASETNRIACVLSSIFLLQHMLVPRLLALHRVLGTLLRIVRDRFP